jgi:hypothetical protein
VRVPSGTRRKQLQRRSAASRDVDATLRRHAPLPAPYPELLGDRCVLVGSRLERRAEAAGTGQGLGNVLVCLVGDGRVRGPGWM